MKFSSVVAFATLLFFATNLWGQNLVVNGDFESDTYTVFPGYSGGGNPDNISGWVGTGNNGINPFFAEQNPSSILGWTRNENSSGQIGINPIVDGSSPFADNGDVDGGVMFLQGIASAFQEVQGLTIGEDYLLQVEYNARNCCGDVPAVALEINGELSDQFPDPEEFDADDIFPVEDGFWWLSEIAFTADAETVLIEFFTEPLDGGDATFTIDNVELRSATGGDNLIVNGDFEDSLDAFSVFPGYLGTGGTGESSPFNDNGNNDTQIAFLQNTASIEQTIEGLTPGVEYTVSFDFNARNCCGGLPVPELSIDDEPIDMFSEEAGVVEPVEEGDWHSFETTFTAESDFADIRIQNASDQDGSDSSFLIDNVFVGLPVSGCNPNTMGDIDGDGTVAFADFLILSSNFGSEVPDHTFGDIDCDGEVNFADFLINSANFGASVSGTQTVPEPSSIWMLLCACCLLVRRTRRTLI